MSSKYQHVYVVSPPGGLEVINIYTFEVIRKDGKIYPLSEHKDSKDSKKCEHVFKIGKNKGKKCSSTPFEKSQYCKKHNKHKHQYRISKSENCEGLVEEAKNTIKKFCSIPYDVVDMMDVCDYSDYEPIPSPPGRLSEAIQKPKLERID